jgi:ubiquinone/menaquinone biosynthesis C-methylase UbiE
MSIGSDHRIVAVSELVRGERALDVGAGTCLLEGRVGGTYVAVDVEAGLLAPGADRVVALVDRLPFRDRSFDSVVCVSVLQYVLDVEGALLELRRLVPPGGQIVVLVPNLAYAKHRLTLLRGRLAWSSPLDSWRSGTLRYFTLKDLLPMLDRLQLRTRGVRCSGRWRRLRNLRPQVLGADLILDLERVP